MELPSRLVNPVEAANALAGFVRARLAELGDVLTPHWERADEAAREVALVIVGAAAPFATTSYARARLLRQLYATGLLTSTESERAVSLLELAQ